MGCKTVWRRCPISTLRESGKALAITGLGRHSRGRLWLRSHGIKARELIGYNRFRNPPNAIFALFDMRLNLTPDD